VVVTARWTRACRGRSRSGRDRVGPVHEHEVKNVDGWETLIAPDPLDRLSDLRRQLNDKTNERRSTAGLCDPGDNRSESCLPGLGVVIV
jgi:hypothetical protein